jgi:hypothetical protein
MEQEETNTLEARRQLIWNAKREGYLLAVEYLLRYGEPGYAPAAAHFLLSRVQDHQKPDAKEDFLVP